jgi:hypothetical protein
MMMRTLALVLESTFKNLDQRIEERWNAGNLSHGFWRTGVIPKLTPVDTLREYGFWQGKAVLENGVAPDAAGRACKGLAGQVSVALIGGHTRMGIFLPNRLLEGVSTWGESLTDAVAKAHDGQPASIIRRVGGDTLFDRIFTEPPFSAEWLLRCTQDIGAQYILENHLAWRVIDLWESALRAVISRQSNDLGIVIQSTRSLPPILTEALPLTLQDAYEIQPGRWVTIVTATDAPDLTEIEAQLQNLLPDHGITIQKDVAP